MEKLSGVDEHFWQRLPELPPFLGRAISVRTAMRQERPRLRRSFQAGWPGPNQGPERTSTWSPALYRGR